MKKKIEIWILMILLIPISLALTGTRSLTPDIGYMCEDGKYQIVMPSPPPPPANQGFTMEEILSQNWHFKVGGLEGNAVNDCNIQTDDTRVKCTYIGSSTRTLIFNVLNAPGTYNTVFSNDPVGDKATGLDSIVVKAKLCQPDKDSDGYPGSPITNICACVSPALDCCDSGNEASLGCNGANAASIHPGAVDIPGDRIDQDCNGKDEPLPSTVFRILPSSAQQGVQFAVILDARHTGEELSLIIDERFDANYFNCGSASSNKGACNIVNNAGKVRWVITDPGTIQLKYYLIPKSTQSCYDFGDVGVANGKYLFQGRNENSIIGDYVIGNMGCVSCTSTGEEICGNYIDENCDGFVCPGKCGDEGAAFNNCNDGIDNDCDQEKDWDTLGIRGPEKGDNDCAVGFTDISVSNPNPFQNTNIDVSCTTTVPNINSVDAYIDSTKCVWKSWNGNIAIFECNVGLAGTKTAKCAIDTSKSYQSGADKTLQITVKSCECSNSLCHATLTGKRCNGCYYTDVSGTENNAAGNCNDSADNDCDNKCDYAGCTGYSTGDDGCPVDVN